MRLVTSFLALQDDGSTWTRILADVPHDAAAIFVYLLIVASGVAIYLGSRGGKGDDRTSDDRS